MTLMPVVSATEKAHMARMLKGTVTHQLSRRMRARRIAQITKGNSTRPTYAPVISSKRRIAKVWCIPRARLSR